MPQSLHEKLQQHLFPHGAVTGEHGAVIAAGVATGDDGTRLLARDLFLAEDGRDYVPGVRGHRALTADFIRDRILYTRKQKLAYLAVHNHGAGDRVGFSNIDLNSHERGYPALLDLNQGNPVGALVFATNAIAGDIWLANRTRMKLTKATVVGSRVMRVPIGSSQPRTTTHPGYHRQTLLFGEAGQRILAECKVGVIGAGGAGSLLIEYLARLGVGHLLVADPDRVDVTNLPRLVGATWWDARGWLMKRRFPDVIKMKARGLAAFKVNVAHRVARSANRKIRFEPIIGDFVEHHIAMRFTDCDFLFLAADSFQARLLFNAMAHQYLIPGIQVGAKVRADKASGQLLDVYAVERPVLPDVGCMWCNELIPPQRLQEEAASESELLEQRYIQDPRVTAPSVITLNASASAQAANDFLMMMTGLLSTSADLGYRLYRPLDRTVVSQKPRRDDGCLECGYGVASRRARGDSVELPSRRRSSPRPR